MGRKTINVKKTTIGFVSDHWQEKDNTYNVLLEISFSDTVLV